MTLGVGTETGNIKKTTNKNMFNVPYSDMAYDTQYISVNTLTT